MAGCQVPTNLLHQQDRVTKCEENLMWKLTIIKVYFLINLVPEETKLNLFSAETCQPSAPLSIIFKLLLFIYCCLVLNRFARLLKVSNTAFPLIFLLQLELRLYHLPEDPCEEPRDALSSRTLVSCVSWLIYSCKMYRVKWRVLFQRLSPKEIS